MKTGIQYFQQLLDPDWSLSRATTRGWDDVLSGAHKSFLRDICLRGIFCRNVTRTIVILIFLVSFSSVIQAAPKNSVNEYASAQKCYHEMDQSSSRNWNRCIDQFEALAEKNPKTEQGKNARFNVARLSQERFEKFSQDSDLKKAFKQYNEFIRQYPKDSLADDAFYRIATLRYDKEKDADRAVLALTALLERYPKGDMAGPARTMLASLKAEGPKTADNKENAKPVIDIVPVPEREEGLREENLKEEPVEEENDFSVRTIVIDPGHGGEDTGARGRKGTKESDVSLQIARKLAYQLRKDLPVTVLMTRTNNKTLSLSERNQFANQHSADLFISIHANASTIHTANGVQTFYLNNATSSAASQLAAFENKALGKTLNLSSRVLATMEQNANTEESRVLAQEVHKTLVKNLKGSYGDVKDLQVATALFDVLIGVKAPSILVETSFITNPKEESRLRDSGYQWKVARGIAAGMKQFVSKRRQSSLSSL